MEGERVLANEPFFAYLKVADGCDNRCSYCAIPLIRGRFRSRPMENIVEEAKRLVDQARAQAPTGAAGPEQSELVEPALPEEDEAGDDPQAHHRRKNPLRHDEEFEQDGFVSFFEKK